MSTYNLKIFLDLTMGWQGEGRLSEKCDKMRRTKSLPRWFIKLIKIKAKNNVKKYVFMVLLNLLKPNKPKATYFFMIIAQLRVNNLYRRREKIRGPPS
jgi:hypothetical protein